MLKWRETLAKKKKTLGVERWLPQKSKRERNKKKKPHTHLVLIRSTKIKKKKKKLWEIINNNKNRVSRRGDTKKKWKMRTNKEEKPREKKQKQNKLRVLNTDAKGENRR